MQPAGAPGPELDLSRPDPEARPRRRHRHVVRAAPVGELCGIPVELGEQRGPAGDHLRLVRGPRGDPRAPRPLAEVLRERLRFDRLGEPAEPHHAEQFRPAQRGRYRRVGADLAGLGRAGIGDEPRPAGVEEPQQHRPHVGCPGGIDGGELQRQPLGRLGGSDPLRLRLSDPTGELSIRGAREVGFVEPLAGVVDAVGHSPSVGFPSTDGAGRVGSHMAKSKFVGNAVKYGVKYGPHVLVAAKALKEPATAYAQKKLAEQKARRAAAAEATTLQAGTVLRVFHQGQPVWVVYSGEEPIGSHPVVDVTLAELVERADLSQRIVPEPPVGAKDRITSAGGQVAGRARAALKRTR